MLSASLRRWLSLAAYAAALAYPLAAHAQSVDYGTLEQVFGEPITTSATGKPQRASEVPADMVIITADDIRRSGASNIPDILQYVTGIDVRQYAFADAQVAVRGYDSPLNPRLLVLVDGRQIYSDIFGFEAWNTVPVQLSEIRQIEVVKGPNTALFGYNAVSGVINIITFDPLLDTTNVATIRGGTQGYGEGELVATQHLGKTAGIRVSAGGWTATGYDQPITVSTPSPRYASFNADGRWQATSWLLLNASGGYTDAHTLTRLPIEVEQNFRDHINYARIGATAETGIGTLTADIYRNQELHETSAPQDNKTLVASLTDIVKFGAATTLRAGFEYRNNTVTSIPLYSGTISYDNYALDGMWEWQISPVYDLINSVRLDHLVLHQSGGLLPIPGYTTQIFNSTTITEPSFNSGLVIHLSDLDTLRVTAARGLQVPSLADFDLQLQVAPHVYALGTPTSQPEAVWNAELGYNRSLSGISGAFETSVFLQRNTAILGPPGFLPYKPVGKVIGSPVVNFGSSNEIGFELGAKGATKGGFRWNASYRFASITQDEAAYVKPGEATDFQRGTPTHAIILGAGYATGPWEFDLNGRLQTHFVDYTQTPKRQVVPVTVPDYVTFSARVAYDITSYLTISGTAQQFNVSRLLQSSVQYVDRRFFATASLRY